MHTVGSYRTRLFERIQEWRLGIRSDDVIDLRQVGLEHEDRRDYGATQFHDFRWMERFLMPEARNEVFIDYGAGLGRVLILAAMLPFKRVVGIEISSVLAERGRKNIAICSRKLHCKSVEILVLDAAAFDVPSDATTIYFNNPFAGQILSDVLDKLHRSYRRQRRHVKLICNLPTKSAFEKQIRRVEWLELRHELELGQERKGLIFAISEGA